MLPILHQIVGSTLVVAGLIVLPLPIPFGLIMLVIGLALLAPYILVIRRLFAWVRRSWPKFDETLRRHHHRFPSIIKSTIDKTHPHAPAE